MSQSEDQELFHEILDDLGYDTEDTAEDGEHDILVYRKTISDRVCYHCKEPVQTEESLDKGKEYLIQRINEEDSPFPCTERTFHTSCWDEYQRG